MQCSRFNAHDLNHPRSISRLDHPGRTILPRHMSRHRWHAVMLRRLLRVHVFARLAMAAHLLATYAFPRRITDLRNRHHRAQAERLLAIRNDIKIHPGFGLPRIHRYVSKPRVEISVLRARPAGREIQAAAGLD